MSRAGFRTDSALSGADTLILSGDIYAGRENQPTVFLPAVTAPSLIPGDFSDPVSGGFVQSVWNHTFSPQSDTSLKLAFDHYSHSESDAAERRSTFDLNFQHHIDWGSRHEIVWGLGYRYTAELLQGSLTVSSSPPHNDNQLFTAFGQDEIALIPGRVFFTFGALLERNDFTGLGFMPSGRISWKLTPHRTAWAAASRALRTPDLTDTSVRLNLGSPEEINGIPVLISEFGNPHFRNEVLLAYEAGYRTTVSNRLSFDIAAYYNDYDKLRTEEPSGLFPESIPAPPHLVDALTSENLGYGEEHGLEIAANWKVTERWTLSPGYGFQTMHIHTQPSSQDTTTSQNTQGSIPNHSAQLRSNVAILRSLEWSSSAYFVDRLPGISVPAYTRLDTSLIWQVNERATFSVVGQNLLQSAHIEFNDPASVAEPTAIRRSAYAKFTWRF